jgi:hypothetical protein
MDMPDGPSALQAEERRALWRRARHAELCEGRRGDGEGAIGQPGVVEGPGFLYRPRQVLLEAGTAQSQRLEERLRREGGVHRSLPPVPCVCGRIAAHWGRGRQSWH